MIRRCTMDDYEQIWAVINDGAEAYRGMIPADCWNEPYMSRAKLKQEVATGVLFWAYEKEGVLTGVMGIQPVADVTPIRHAYVRSHSQNQGIGSRLLAHLRQLTDRPVLIGTWADASWAIYFYERHGFQKVSFSEKERLLRAYWTVPERQIETSVVLADPTWRRQHPTAPPAEDV